MYSFQTGSRSAAPGSGAGRRAAIPRIVWWIGLSSLLADISAESVTTALPVFLFAFLSLSPQQVGILDGVYQGGAAVVGVIAGYWADKRESNKPIAFLGYALSAVSRLGLLFGINAGLLAPLASVCADRVGKGIRTAPRDAIIAGSTSPESLGAAFGVHRALDAVGALLGPLVAGCVLWLMPDRFDLVFGISFLFGAAGLVVFKWMVVEPKRSAATALSTTTGAEELRRPLDARTTAGLLAADRTFCALLALVVCLTLFTISDSLVYLFLQHEAGIDGKYVPLMFALTAAVFLVTAVPIGRIADRLGRLATFTAGHGVLALLYLWLAFGPPVGVVGVLVVVSAMGLFYAATDGVLSALLMRTVDVRVRASALAVLMLALGLTRIASSVVYGWLWQGSDLHWAMSIFAVGASACCLLVVMMVLRARRAAAPAPERCDEAE